MTSTENIASLLDTINNIRETTITSHYNAAVADLQDQIKNSPLQTKFIVYSGCVSEEIAREIASRIQTSNITATVQTTGFFTTTYYLDIEVGLPASLIHEVKPESKTSEVDEPVKEEIKPVTSVVDEPLHTE